MKYIRQIDAKVATDPHGAEVIEYNQASGAKKTIPAGPVLKPLPLATPTCSAVAAVGLPDIGKNIAVYNNASTVGTITLGTDGTVTVLAPGAVNVAGQAGIPCPPNAWTYIGMGNQQFLIASAVTLLCYIIDDGTKLVSVPN